MTQRCKSATAPNSTYSPEQQWALATARRCRPGGGDLAILASGWDPVLPTSRWTAKDPHAFAIDVFESPDMVQSRGSASPPSKGDSCGVRWSRASFSPLPVSVSVSAQNGIVALGKAHTRSAPALSSLPKIALETVPVFVWLNSDRSRPWRVECRPLPFSTHLSLRRSMLWCSGLSVLWKFVKPRSTSALPSCRPDVISAVLASLSARSISLTPASPGQ